MRLLSYLMPYKRVAALGLALTLTMTATSLVPTYLTKVLIDDVFGGGRLGLFPIIIGVLISVHLGSAVISVFRGYTMEWLGIRKCSSVTSGLKIPISSRSARKLIAQPMPNTVGGSTSATT